MILSTIFRFAIIALSVIPVHSLTFDIRVRSGLEDTVIKVMGKQESDGDFVELPRNWPGDSAILETYVNDDERMVSVDDGDSEGRDIYTTVMVFPDLLGGDGKFALQISMPDYSLTAS
jgi:hypothetical protein